MAPALSGAVQVLSAEPHQDRGALPDPSNELGPAPQGLCVQNGKNGVLAPVNKQHHYLLAALQLQQLIKKDMDYP